MLTTELLSRSLGQSITPTDNATFAQLQNARLVHALQPAPGVRFAGASAAHPRTHRTDRTQSSRQIRARRRGDADYEGGDQDVGEGGDADMDIAHHAGVNCCTVDAFEGRYMLSGGADGGITMWDLEAAEESRRRGTGVVARHTPMGSVARADNTHRFGVTTLSFYPFDSLAFLSSSYDHTLKLYDSTSLTLSASFDLSYVVYSHALSPIASHLLVACATQHPAVRLVDLRSGAATHSLAGHGGAAILTVAWSPKDEHVLASGGTDGTVRFWDIRMSAGMLASLDSEDVVGIVGYNGVGLGARSRQRGRAHAAAVNGIVWNNDGRTMVTTGHDEKIRVWNVEVGANTLANFGPVVRNKSLSTVLPAVTPRGLVPTGQDMLFFPNEAEILVYELYEGKLLKRLRVPGVASSTQRAGGPGARSTHRVTSLTWRPHNIELISAHTDGTIRSWQPRTRMDAFVDKQEAAEDEDSDTEVGSRKRKRQVLVDIHRDLTQQKVTYS